MEERIMDEDEGRGIRLKRTEDGETDAVEDTGDELIVDLPEEEYDEDLVGLTPSQLQEELEKRAKAREDALKESKKLTEEGNSLLAEGKFSEAAPLFSQAALYDSENVEAAQGYAAAVTENFTVTEPLYEQSAIEALSALPAARQAAIEHLGEKLKKELASFEAEEEALAPVFAEKQETRREAFAANKRHYVILASVFLFCLAVFVIATAISADNILRTQSILPIVLTAVFGVISFVALLLTAVFATRLVFADRLCRNNEKLSSTQDGRRLLFLRKRIEALKELLGEA